MDPAGARALAQRLADGKAPDEMTLEESLAAEARSAKTGPAKTPAAEQPTPELGNGVIYVRPTRRSASHEVWMYVRASDGRLQRVR